MERSRKTEQHNSSLIKGCVWCFQNLEIEIEKEKKESLVLCLCLCLGLGLVFVIKKEICFFLGFV